MHNYYSVGSVIAREKGSPIPFLSLRRDARGGDDVNDENVIYIFQHLTFTIQLTDPYRIDFCYKTHLH